MTDYDIRRNPPGLNEVRATLDELGSLLHRDLQQRGYHRYHTLHSRSFWQLLKSSIVVGGAVGLCCAIFAGNWWALRRAQKFRDRKPLRFIRENFVCSLENWRAGRWWVVLSSSVTHFDPIHLGVNMFSLWSIGQGAVHAFGVPAFLGLWIISGSCCCAASLWWERRREETRNASKGQRRDKSESEKRKWFVPKDETPHGVTYGGSVGASGVLQGLLGALTCFAPNALIRIVPIPYNIRMWIVTGAGTLASLYWLDSGSLPRIGHAGHLGGLVGGMISYYGFIRPTLRRIPRF